MLSLSALLQNNLRLLRTIGVSRTVTPAGILGESDKSATIKYFKGGE